MSHARGGEGGARLMAERGRPGRRPTDDPGTARAGPAPPPAPAPAPRQVRWWLRLPPEQLTTEQAADLERRRGQCPAVHTASLVVQAFGRLVRDRDRAAFDRWVATAEAGGMTALGAVATCMRRDAAAIVAALRLPWSNGQTEGQVTRLKLVKRRRYGRGKRDLLQRRRGRPV